MLVNDSLTIGTDKLERDAEDIINRRSRAMALIVVMLLNDCLFGVSSLIAPLQFQCP